MEGRWFSENRMADGSRSGSFCSPLVKVVRQAICMVTHETQFLFDEFESFPSSSLISVLLVKNRQPSRCVILIVLVNTIIASKASSLAFTSYWFKTQLFPAFTISIAQKVSFLKSNLWSPREMPSNKNQKKDSTNVQKVQINRIESIPIKRKSSNIKWIQIFEHL
jgi:hypothetical protein